MQPMGDCSKANAWCAQADGVDILVTSAFCS